MLSLILPPKGSCLEVLPQTPQAREVIASSEGSRPGAGSSSLLERTAVAMGIVERGLSYPPTPKFLNGCLSAGPWKDSETGFLSVWEAFVGF